MFRLAAVALAANTVLIECLATGSSAGAASFDVPSRHGAGLVSAAVFGVDAAAFRDGWRAALSHPETVALAGLKLDVQRTLSPTVVALAKPRLSVPRVELSPPTLKYEPPRFSAFVPNQKPSDVSFSPRLDDINVEVPVHLFTPAFAPNMSERFAQLTASPRVARPSLTFNLSDSNRARSEYVPVDPGTRLPPPDLSRTIFRSYATSRNSPVLDTSLSYSLTRTVTFSAQYDQQHLYGPYMLAPSPSSDEGTRRDQYGASITYSIPDTNKAVTVQAQQTKYLDKQIPSSDATIPKVGAYLTIRF